MAVVHPLANPGDGPGGAQFAQPRPRVLDLVRVEGIERLLCHRVTSELNQAR